MMEEDDIISASLTVSVVYSYYGKWYGGLCGYEN